MLVDANCWFLTFSPAGPAGELVGSERKGSSSYSTFAAKRSDSWRFNIAWRLVGSGRWTGTVCESYLDSVIVVAELIG